MERPPDNHHEHAPDPDLPSGDEARITRGIADAMADGRTIDDATARRIASQLHDGQASALYALASSGAVEPEVLAEIADATGALPLSYETWGDSLLDYIRDRARARDRDPRRAWDLLTSDDPAVAAQAAESNQRQHRQALFEHYILLGINPEDATSAIEVDDFLHADWTKDRPAPGTDTPPRDHGG